jgi:hypothetical protein
MAYAQSFPQELGIKMINLYTICPIELESLREYLEQVNIWIEQLKLKLEIDDE